MQVFNTFTQLEEDVTWSVDGNDEIVATFSDGHFLKFPGGTTEEQLQEMVDATEKAGQGQEVITPEMEAAQVAQAEADKALVEQLNGNTIPEGQSNDNIPTA
jgi:hypothetical protein